MAHLKTNLSSQTEAQFLCCPSLVDSSAPTILPPRVQIQSPPSRKEQK